MFRSSGLAVVSTLSLVLSACCQTKKAPAPERPAAPSGKSAALVSTFSFDRAETVQKTQLATTRVSPHGGKPVVEKKARILVHVLGSDKADFDAFAGPNNHLKPHNRPQQIPGPPTQAKPDGGVPDDVDLPKPAVYVNVVDETEAESGVSTASAIYQLINGFVYATGTAPIAQTDHVIAGSDSTKFIVEVDHLDQTDPNLFVHRVYAVDAPSNVYVQAREGGQRVGPMVPIPTGRYIEVRRDPASGSWIMYGPSVYPTGPNTTVGVILKAAEDANVAVP